MKTMNSLIFLSNSASAAVCLLWMLMLLLSPLSIIAEEEKNLYPNPSLQLDLFEMPQNTTKNTTTFRNDLCDLSNQVNVLKTLNLENALQGLNIKTALYIGEFVNWDVETDSNGAVISRKLNKYYPGLVPRLLDELCERAGCNWRDQFATVSYDDLPDDKTFTDMLLWTNDVYDVTAEWWMRSIERLQLGATFTEQWYDGTIIMVSKQSTEEKDEFDPWGWLAPFDRGVWIMVIATVFVSAFLYWLLEVLDVNADQRKEQLDPIEATWMFATAFAGQFEFDPHTGPARLFTFSTAFWSLLMVSAYTANLASFLVIRNTPEVRVESLQQAVRLNLNMCVWRSSGTDAAFSTAFPVYANSARLIRTSQRGIFERLLNGECDIGITEVSTWDVFQYDASLNADCSLAWVGRPFRSIPASFGVRSDAGTLCTSLLRDVFSLHLHEMENDGKIQELWDEHIEQTATLYCSSNEEETTDRRRRLKMDDDSDTRQLRRLKAAKQNAAAENGGGDDETTKLTLTNMGGVFLIHGMLSLLSLCCALAVWFRQRRKEKLSKNRISATSSDHSDGSPPANSKENALSPAAFSEDNSLSDGSLHYFDAASETGKLSENVGSIEELRAEMQYQLSNINRTLAALLESDPRNEVQINQPINHRMVRKRLRRESRLK